MQFKPKSKDELDAMNLMAAGSYQFRVATAKEKKSKNGNDMIELVLDVYGMNGISHAVYDYLLEITPHKLFAFCEATGLEQHYHQGTLRAQDCVDRTGYVEIVIQKGADNPQGGSYPDKNGVKRYFPKMPQDDKFVDDDVPF